MPKPPPPSSDLINAGALARGTDRVSARGSVPGADTELSELMAMLGEDAAEDDAAGIDDAELATLLEGLGASAKEREESEVRQLLEGLPELSSDADLGDDPTSETVSLATNATLDERLTQSLRLLPTDSGDADGASGADGQSPDIIGGDDVAIETLEAPVDEYLDGAEEDSDPDVSPLRRNAAAGVQVPSVMRRRVESDLVTGDYLSSEYNSEAYGENYGTEKLHEIGSPLEDSEGTEPALPEGIQALPTPVEPFSAHMTVREMLPLDAGRNVLDVPDVPESAQDTPFLFRLAPEPVLSTPDLPPELTRASAPMLERSPQRAQAFPTDPEHTLPPLRDPLASRKAIAEERIQQLLTEDIRSVQAFRILRFFVVTGVDRVTLDELQEELVEPRDTLLGILSHLLASGLVIADGTTYALNTRARKLSLLGTAVAQWQTPRRRELLLGWLKKHPVSI